jgi:hypothetical protein
VAQIVVGRTSPSPAAVEAIAEAVTGAAIDPLVGWYEKADAVREMTDGTFCAAEADRHPNPVAEAIRWHITEGELIQIIGRARGVNRKAADPVDVLLMVNTPIPVPVERLISAAGLDPSPADLMMAAGGVAFTNPTDISVAYPTIWSTRKAAEHAIRRSQGRRSPPFSNNSTIITEWGRPPAEVTYQRSGAGRSKGKALVDLATVPDPEAWLTERLGPLSRYALMVPPAAAVPSEPIFSYPRTVRVGVAGKLQVWPPASDADPPWAPTPWQRALTDDVIRYAKANGIRIVDSPS